MKKLAGIIFGGLAIFLTLSSCNNSNEVFKPKYDQNTSCKINMVGHYENFEAIESEFVRFNEYYPNVELTYTYLNNYNKLITTSLSSDNSPDLFFTYPWMISNNSYSEIFDYTEDLSKEELDIDLSTIRDGLIYKDNSNSISMVPIYITTYGMIVNEDLFEKESISIPKTYTELVSSCQSFKDKGYVNPMMGHNSMIMYPMYFPHFCSQIMDNQTAITKLNNLDSDAGELMRPSLNIVKDFMDHNFIDLTECNKLKNDYGAVIERFFQGDIPMMLSSANTVSGTEKRETTVDAYRNNPFKYSFHPVPSTEEGGLFLNTVSLCFSVNKESKNLDMSNEFMRFLVRTSELQNMSKIKRMITSSKDMSLDTMYSSFGEVKAINLAEIGLNDAPDVQVRKAGIKVASKEMTIDEAISNFGNFS